MMNNSKIAVFISSEIAGVWIEKIVKIFNNNLTIYLVPEPSLSFLNIFFLKLNYLIFGKPNTLQTTSLKLLALPKNLENLNSYDYFINFSNFNLSSFTKKNKLLKILTVKISLRTIIYNTINDYKKVNFFITDGVIAHKSSVRFHPLSVSKNVNLTLHSIIDLLEVYFLKEGFKVEKGLIKQGGSIKFKQYIAYFIRLIKKIVSVTFYNDQWVLGYSFKEKPLDNLLKNPQIIPPKDRFWADPIIVKEKGIIYVFIEELIYTNKRAHLSVFILNKDGSYSLPKIILEKPYHLSYPYVFKHKETFYMIPETANNNDIQLYESISFPYEWKLVKILIDDIEASDVSLFFHNNKWWMFTSVRKHKYSSYDNDLSIFYSEELISSNWKPHKQNPIKKDISNARQGGTFIKGENNIRVSQNGENSYGYGFNLNKILHLSENSYKEELIYKFIPEDKKIKGIHTYCQLSDVAVYDILTKRSKFI